MESTKKKNPKGLGLVGAGGHHPVNTAPQEPLTLKMLDEYVAKLVSFERQAVVGQEQGLQPAALTSLSDLKSPGKSAFKFKKPDTDPDKIAQVIAPILKKTEES